MRNNHRAATIRGSTMQVLHNKASSEKAEKASAGNNPGNHVPSTS